MNEKRNMMNECYSCKHKRDVPVDCHIRCVNPDEKMKGDKRGIMNGSFMYPALFDPTWKKKDCANYEEIE